MKNGCLLKIKTMNTKLPVYPAVIATCLLGLVGLVLLWLRFSVSISTQSDTSSLSSAVPSELPTPDIVTSATSSVPTLVSKSTETVVQETPPVSPPDSTEGLRQGALRVSNQTNQPVRLALLARRIASGSRQPSYANPAHWDFAPMEGSGKGLVLSLPDGNLKLKTGDILVAFAQDGSRRYWGPYVVDETTLPVWNSQTSEWQLILR